MNQKLRKAETLTIGNPKLASGGSITVAVGTTMRFLSQPRYVACGCRMLDSAISAVLKPADRLAGIRNHAAKLVEREIASQSAISMRIASSF
jgi:hypothetical protein